MGDIYDRYKRMTFAELRKYLKDQRTIQKIYYFLPAVVSVLMILSYCMQGWSTYPSMVFEMNQQKTIHADFTTFGLFDWVVCLLMIPLLPFEKTHLKFDFASSIILSAYMVVKLLLFESFDILIFVAAVYYLLAALHLRIVCKRIVFIKSLPDYPFLPSVELERQRELEMQKYSENSLKNRQLIKEAEKKVAGTLEEKMEQLPKRHIEAYKISRGQFDDTEADYSDKLIGEDLKQKYEAPEFEDINEKYKEDFNTEDKLTIERRERIDEIDEGFDGDYMAQPADRFRPDMIDEASAHFKLEKKSDPSTARERFDDEEKDYGGDIPVALAYRKADFDESEDTYTDESFGSRKDQFPVIEEKPKGYKPVV